MDTRSEIQQAARAELQAYLESWGFAVYDSESEADLREAALDNFDTEGPGMGPMSA